MLMRFLQAYCESFSAAVNHVIPSNDTSFLKGVIHLQKVSATQTAGQLYFSNTRVLNDSSSDVRVKLTQQSLNPLTLTLTLPVLS